MSTNRSLEGKLAIVTGASRGIGAAICQNLAAKGCNLVMGYTSPSSEPITIELANSLSLAHNIKAVPCRADMGEVNGPESLIQMTRQSFMHPVSGNLTIHILINNAGVAGNRFLAGNPAAALVEDFQKQYAVNVLGPLLLMQAVIPYLPTDRTGRVVNLSSVSASLGLRGQSVYGGTKAALEAMTRTWSRELHELATVNCVNPGPVATEMYETTDDWFQIQMRPWCEVAPRAQVKTGRDDPVLVQDVNTGGADGKGLGGRAATPAEIAGVVGMLCADEATWCTGSVICANGGMRFSP